MKCNYDCFNCKFSDCVSSSKFLTHEEECRIVDFDSAIEKDRLDERIRMIDDPKYRATLKYRHTEKGKEMLHRMNTNNLAKERSKRYEQTEKAKERRRRYENKPERKAYIKAYNKMYYAKKKSEKEMMKNADNKEQQAVGV